MIAAAALLTTPSLYGLPPTPVASIAEAGNSEVVPIGLSVAVQGRLAELSGQPLTVQAPLSWGQLQSMVTDAATAGNMVEPSTGAPWDLPTLLEDSDGSKKWLPSTASEGDLIVQME
ncbi:MAG TPA: hypothetical protein VG815_13045, partial [Chloroflexota bacterium]|nr:hypothetical protein [Chloroflexota bacterium]